MGDVLTFMIKGDACAFVRGDGMGDAPAFVIKGDMPLETCISFTCIIEMRNRNARLTFVIEAGVSQI
jgi:hypothetical protein